MPALSELDNDRIAMGGNNPPAFEAHKVSIDDLRAEASAWLDGKSVESAEEAEGLNTLLDLARKAAKAADEARAAEKKPFLDAGKAVDEQWKPIIKAAELIVDACKHALTPWNIAEKKRREAEAARARAEAEAEAEALRKAAREAATGTIEALEQAAQLEDSTKAAERIAKKAEKEASGAGRLRTSVRAEVTDLNAAIKHFWVTDRDAFAALVLELAQRDARAGKRSIPGITIQTEQRAF